MIVLAGGVLAWLKRRVSDRKIVGSMPVVGITANYLTGIFCGAKD